MSIHRFTARPCRECPAEVLVGAIADWLLSPDRFRHGEADKEAKHPGRCVLCGGPTHDAFILRLDGEVKGVPPGSPHLPKLLEAWRGAHDPKITDATGREWRINPVFVCEEAMGTKPCLFSYAEVEVRRRKRDAAKRADAAERAAHVIPCAPRTKSSI